MRWILLTALLKANWIGMYVYGDTTSRLHGYGSVMLLLLTSLSCTHLMGSKLFSKCAGMFLSMGSRALESNHEMRCVGPLTFDTPYWSYFDLWAGFGHFD